MPVRTGKCLCGAVGFSVEAETVEIAVCHCGMCRRWTGGPFAGLHVTAPVAFSGAESIAVFRSSDWGERGFCRTCGTTLFWRLQADHANCVLSAGAFDDQDGFRMVKQIYIDEKPAFYDFAQDTPRLTGAEFLASIGLDGGQDGGEDGS